jgi:hypothetical protein
MRERTQDRLFAACGIVSVVVLLAWSFLGSAGRQPSYTLGSSPARIAHELARPVDPLGWAGAYVELLSFGCFLWLGWIVYASVSLARRAPAREAAAVATSRGYVASPR